MIGTKLAHYEITSHLGTGGMGEVYQATDTKLGRSVAIKFLPEAFANDDERVARFDREARVLASLNHSNIAAIFGLEESGERKFLVMELVGGETLAERIKRGPIPVDESLQIAKQICEALEAAHEKGIIHRDLKPANVKITPDGKVKVLDFGLAKALENAPANTALSNSPTLSMAATNAGLILGTAAYMSPEQAKGRAVDKRTDIFAFGCVLYEMLTGRAAFEGEDVTDILSAVVRMEPDWNRLTSHTPTSIQRLLRRALKKDPRQRLSDIRDARIEIEEAEMEKEQPLVSTPARNSRVVWVALAFAAVMIVALAIPVVRHLRETSPQLLPEMRLEINTPPTTDPSSLAISPDGQTVVFSANSGGSRLWLRSLGSTTSRPLIGTDNATYPFWASDSQSVGFFADGKLKRIDIDGGTVRAITNAPLGRGGTWNRADVILFVGYPSTGIWRVSASGGEPAEATRLQGGRESSHRFPQFLPDGRHFLYYSQGERSGVYIGQLDSFETKRLLDSDAAATFASSGQLLFVRQGTLFAQNVDLKRLALAENSFPLAQVATDGISYAAAVSASVAGPIVYRTILGSERQFAWFDRSGKLIQNIGNPDNTFPTDPSASPDGRSIAVHRNVNANLDIWSLELGRGILTRFTSDPASDLRPLWSPDGNRIVFASDRNGRFDLYQKMTTGVGSEELILAGTNPAPMDWSPDGRFLLYRSTDPSTGIDLWALPLVGDRKPFPVVRTNFEERDGQFSPDGKWIAYQSNESGRFEIYVQPFPGPGGRTQISTNGGAQVRWRHDGKELFYVGLDDRLMAVPIHLSPNGPQPDVAVPVPLFATHIGGAVQGTNRQQYIVSNDGQRFLMNTVTNDATSPITVILNWHPGLAARENR